MSGPPAKGPYDPDRIRERTAAAHAAMTTPKQRPPDLRAALERLGRNFTVGTDNRSEWHLHSCDYARGAWQYRPDEESCEIARAALEAETEEPLRPELGPSTSALYGRLDRIREMPSLAAYDALAEDAIRLRSTALRLAATPPEPEPEVGLAQCEMTAAAEPDHYRQWDTFGHVCIGIVHARHQCKCGVGWSTPRLAATPPQPDTREAG